MILEISPDSSPIVRFAAAALLYTHIGAGCVALAAGAAALIFRKGSRSHRFSGDVFIVSMLIMATIGAAVSPFLRPPQWANVIAGVFTLYLVVSAWLATRAENTMSRRIDVTMLAIIVVVAIGAIAIGGIAASSNNKAVASDAAPAFIFATIATLAAVGDVKWLARKSSSLQRTVRHLWRMCFALWIATSSFFLGQAKMFPAAVRGTGLLFLPVLAVLGVMFYWIFRLRLSKKHRMPNVPAVIVSGP